MKKKVSKTKTGTITMVKKGTIKPIPPFKTLEEEANFWDTHSFADYWDTFEDVDKVVVGLHKSRTETVVVRLQKDFKKRLESIAKNRGLDLSGLIRMWLLEKLQSLR